MKLFYSLNPGGMWRSTLIISSLLFSFTLQAQSPQTKTATIAKSFWSGSEWTSNGTVNDIQATDVQSSDNVYATSSIDAGTNSQDIILSNFGFTIPDAAIISGIVVTVERKAGAAGRLSDDVIMLTKNANPDDPDNKGTGFGNSLAKSGTWSANDAIITYGSETEKWGEPESLIPSVINRERFGVIIEVKNNTANQNAVTAFVDHVTISVYYSEPIVTPVKLTSFTAQRENSYVNLDWISDTESNNKGFEVQRKLAGDADFEMLAFVPSKAVDGNSTSQLSYNYKDYNISDQTSQYRLKQIDLDGSFTYSDTRVIEGFQLGATTRIYPNPANGRSTIYFNSLENRDVRVLDLIGRQVRQYNNITDGQLEIKDLLPGTYFVSILEKNYHQKQVLKLVITQ